MKTLNISQAKTHLSRLVDQVASGEDVVIARAGRPVARLTRLQEPTGKRRLGLRDGQGRIPEDFNRPLPEGVVRAFENQ